MDFRVIFDGVQALWGSWQGFDGFHLKADRCEEKVCHCLNGHGARGGQCPAADAQGCDACDQGAAAFRAVSK